MGLRVLDLMLACWSAVPNPDTAGCGVWGVPQLVLAHWSVWLRVPRYLGAGVSLFVGVPGALGGPGGDVSLLMGRVKSPGLWLQGCGCPRVDLLVGRAGSQWLAVEPQKSVASAGELVGRARSWAFWGSCGLRQS